MIRKIMFLLLFLTPTMATAKAEINLDEVTRTVSVVGLGEVLEGCELHKGTFTVAGSQYSESGNTINLIRFKRSDGKVFAIPTGFSELANHDKSKVQEIITEDTRFFIEFTICGSGGFMQLVSLYLTV